ncbi:Hypothetical protein GbCGDNIH5_8164 [Granulibacter bethesdensis]|nr:Hypothetical protein GbCGDNIH5_8164 [Granulibacter bethesdensis]
MNGDRSISAHAEEPRETTASTTAGMVYLRARGGTEEHAISAEDIQGLSPRTRRNHTGV